MTLLLKFNRDIIKICLHPERKCHVLNIIIEVLLKLIGFFPGSSSCNQIIFAPCLKLNWIRHGESFISMRGL